MSSKDTFENQLKSKLEAYEAPYDPSYWKAYSKKYRKFDWWAFFKLWYVPYIFSGLLFGLLLFWQKGDSVTTAPNPSALTAAYDTIVVNTIITQVDTIVIRDTVYLVSNTYANGASRRTSSPFLKQNNDATAFQTKNTGAFEPRMATGTTNPSVRKNGGLQQREQTDLNNSASAIQNVRETETGTATSTAGSNRNLQQPGSTDRDRSNLANENSNAEPDAEEPQFVKTKGNKQFAGNAERRAKALERQKAYNEKLLAQNDSLEQQSSMDSATFVVQPNEATEEDSAIDEEDLAEENEKVAKKPKTKIQLGIAAGPQINVFLPFSYQNIDTYVGGFAGYGGTFSVNRFELQTGLQLGFMFNDLDDFEQFPASILSNYPDYDAFNPIPEDIEILSTHIHIPLFLGYKVLANDKFTLSTRFGVLGNYLVSETFEYSFNDFTSEEVRTIPNNTTRFLLSHVSGGIAANYHLNSKWIIEAASQYYHPLSVMGRGAINPSGVSVQLGLLRKF